MSAKKKKKASSSDLRIAGAVLISITLIAVIFYFWLKPSTKTEGVKKSPLPVKSGMVLKKPAPVQAEAITKPPIKPTELPGVAKPKGKIAIVIDDWGYSTNNCLVLKDIHVPLALAILPRLKHTRDILECGASAQKDLMLHLPMQPYANKDVYPDDYLLNTRMSPNKVEEILNEILRSMPQISGVNNHMGSKAMESQRLVRLIFRHLKRHNLFFMDSMTSPNHSFGRETAQEQGLRFAQRDVFLDNTNTREAIIRQLQNLKKKADAQGYAIAIGHDRQLTMSVLKEQIPILQQQGYVFVSIKDLVSVP